MIDIYYELINEESNNKAHCGTLDSEQNAPRNGKNWNALSNKKYVIIFYCIVKIELESDWLGNISINYV